MDCSMPGFPVFHHLPEFAQTHVLKSAVTSNHLTLCRPFLLLHCLSQRDVCNLCKFWNSWKVCQLHLVWPENCYFWSLIFSILIHSTWDLESDRGGCHLWGEGHKQVYITYHLGSSLSSTAQGLNSSPGSEIWPCQ